MNRLQCIEHSGKVLTWQLSITDFPSVIDLDGERPNDVETTLLRHLTNTNEEIALPEGGGKS